MKVYPIANPLPGEQVVGLDPPLAPEVDSGWRRRLNLMPGRALDDHALTAEQDVRAGRLATEGQMLSPGIIAGLDVALETDPTEGAFLRIRAGTGDRKSTRLNSSHDQISYAVFCLKKKNSRDARSHRGSPDKRRSWLLLHPVFPIKSY